MIETKEIQMPRKQMLGVLFLQYGTLWISVGIAGMIALVVLGFSVDYRFFILALMWLLLIIPMMISYLYFFYGMQPLTAYNIIPHRLKFSRERIDVSFPEKTDEEGRVIGKAREMSISKQELQELKPGVDYVILYFRQPNKGWLWVPTSGFSSIEEFKKVIEDERFQK